MIRGRLLTYLLSCCVSLLVVSAAWGQAPGSASSSQQTLANQLPLSGRGTNGGGVTATQSAIPGTTASVNTLNTSVQAQGPYSGSARSASIPFSGKLSLDEAVRRDLQYNLGAVGFNSAVRQAQGQSRVVRSALLPNISGYLSETVQQTNLAAEGLRIHVPIPSFSFPTVVGPFNYFDLRARLTQSVADLTALNNYRSAKETVAANQLSVRDARDLIVLAVGGSYLQVIAANARVKSAQAKLETAEALFKQASEQRAAGVLSQIDMNRAEIQRLTTRERLASLENDYAKQKINLARLSGLEPTNHYEITDSIPYASPSAVGLDAALEQAFSQRPDLQAAQAQIRAAQYTRTAARAERLPSLSLSADYGAIGVNPSQSHGTFAVVGTLRIPIWAGGRTEGDIEQADATLGQRKAELEDVRNHIESDIRRAFLDLEAATSQVEVARCNLDVTRQRFDAGISEYVEVVQAQESLASAELDYINSVFSHNVAKLSLARAIGDAESKLASFLKLE